MLPLGSSSLLRQKYRWHVELTDLYCEELALLPEPTIGQRIIIYVPVPDTDTLKKRQSLDR